MDSDSATPTDSYRLRDVEAAAVEAGISQRYVALAVDELRAKPAGVALTPAVSPWKERLATRVLGTAQRTLSVSRLIRATPRAVLQALGRSLQAAPWSLSLRDTLGGHPLDGGVLVFDIPAMVDGNYKWTMTRYGVYVPEVRVTLAALPSDPRVCEVTMTIDLRRGLGTNLASYATLGGIGSGGGGLVAALVAKKALALVGAAIAGPAVATALVIGVGVLAAAGPVYRWEMRKAAKELDAALSAIEVSLRAFDIFGEAPPPPPAAPSGGGDAGSLIIMS